MQNHDTRQPTSASSVRRAAVQLLALLLVANGAAARDTLEDPHQEFSTSGNHTDVSTITWQSASNVQAECDRQSKRRGFKPFAYSVEACSFWEGSRYGNQCHIVTSKRVNFHTIGHEMRHCFQGAFHK